MIDRDTKVLRFTLSLMLSLALLALSACTSSSSPTSGSDRETRASSGSGANINVNCIGDSVANPPGSFHYSYKTSGAQGDIDKEADITPQTMEVTIADKSGTHTYHGNRSDEASWNGAVLDLSGAGMTILTSRIDFVKDKSAVTRAGAETVGGYSTTKYAIDTDSANAADKKTFAVMFGPNSYEKGTIWVTDQGCPVKFLLDQANQKSDGTVDKSHYEMAMTKK